MFNHYLRLALKVLGKYRYYTFISVFGLVCGMFSALVIGKYVGASLQFDSFHLNRARIYSVSQQEVTAGNVQPERPYTYQGVAEILQQFPEVLRTTLYMQHVESLIIPEQTDAHHESFTEDRIFISDSNFFQLFTFRFVHGDPKSAFIRGNTLVLTESTARKYFGDSNAIGKNLAIRTSWGEERRYEVTGVLEDIPLLSRFRFNILLNRTTTNAVDLWNLPDYSVHVFLRENANANELAGKLSRQVQDVPELKAANKDVTLTLRSLEDVRLSDTEYLLAVVGIVITIICWVNYLNQSIAQAYWRTKEIGVLKVLGASKVSLTKQFAVESILICGTAFLLVSLLFMSLENTLRSLTHGHLLPLTGDPTNLNMIFILVFAAGIGLTTLGPSLVLFRQKLENALRTSFTPNVGGIGIRKIFVVVQFSISSILMIGIFVITGQLDYMETKDKGIDIEDVLIVKAPMARDTTWGVKVKTLQLLKQRSAELPFITKVASSTTVPGEEYRNETYLSRQGHDSKIIVHQNGVDENFFSLYNVRFIAGHDFIPNARAKNSRSIVLNESAARALGVSDPASLINEQVIDHENPDVTYDVIGVISDYHQTSLRYEIRPLAFRYNLFRGHCSIRFDRKHFEGGTIDNTLASLKDIWKESYPDASFDYFLLSDKFSAQDRADQRFGSLFEAFTILSVVLSCLGLFGLSILISTKRQKEIGIRKTFGATSFNILGIFMKGYLGQLSIALTLGSAAGYLLMDEWLTSYANRIEIGPGLIASAVMTLIAIFLVTVSYHTIRAARTNPVGVLRR